MIIGVTQIKSTILTSGRNIWMYSNFLDCIQRLRLLKMRVRMLRAKLIQPPRIRKSVALLLQSSLKLCPMPIMIKAMTSRTIIWSRPSRQKEAILGCSKRSNIMYRMKSLPCTMCMYNINGNFVILKYFWT